MPVKGWSKHKVDWNLIKDRIEAGESLTSVSKDLGPNIQTIHNQLKDRFGITVGRSWVDDDTKKKVAWDYVNGLSVKELQEKYDLSGKSITKYIKNEDIAIRSSRKIPEDRIEEFSDYTKRVRMLSASSRKIHGLTGKKGYHWHHQVTICDAFLNDLTIEQCASIQNQILLPAEENLSAGSKSTMTIEELKEKLLQPRT